MLKEARLQLEAEKEKIRSGIGTDKIRLDDLFIKYMKTQPDSDWTHNKTHIYDLYIGESGLTKITKKLTKEQQAKKEAYKTNKIGHRLIDQIKPLHIETITSDMSKKYSLSPRTCKGVLEVLNPLFKYAIVNKYIKENPAEHLNIKVPSQKKIVTNATKLFKKVYYGITDYYKDEPFYKALFLFGFTGRRKSEILNLKWENIDLNNDYYWIEDTKNGDKQRFPLPAMVKIEIMQIKDDRKGLVFKSPVTGKALVNTDRQMNQIRKHTGVEVLTLHYMRNILVSALAEQSIEAITLNGILGHKDINTINKYLSNSTMKSGLKGLKAVDSILDAEVIGNG